LIDEASLNRTRQDSFLVFRDFELSYEAAQVKKTIHGLLEELLHAVVRLGVVPPQQGRNSTFYMNL
jgi:hypothetical protein